MQVPGESFRGSAGGRGELGEKARKFAIYDLGTQLEGHGAIRANLRYGDGSPACRRCMLMCMMRPGNSSGF